MRLRNILYEASGDEFYRLRPELAGFPLPVLRVALREWALELDPPATPVLHHSEGDVTGVWVLEAYTPTLVRPRQWIDGPPALVELSTHDGPYLTHAVTAPTAVAACWAVYPPGVPGIADPLRIAARKLRESHLHLAHRATEPLTPYEAADLLSVLTVCTHLYQPLLAGLTNAIRDYQLSQLRAVAVPGVVDAYGGGTDVVRANTRDTLLAAARALEDLPALLDIAHRDLRRLQPRTDDATPS